MVIMSSLTVVSCCECDVRRYNHVAVDFSVKDIILFINQG